MKPRLIDTHAHLDAEIYAKDLDIVVQQAIREGVWIVTIGDDYESSKRAIAIAERYGEGVYAAIGLHPLKVTHAQSADDTLLALEKFHALAAHPKVVAIGETGLDFHTIPEHQRNDPQRAEARLQKENQMRVFGKFLDLSRETRLPLLLHCREAHEEMLAMLETWDKTTRGFNSRGIVHCFSGDVREARRYYDLDFAISFTGLMTHGAYQTEVLKKSPDSRIVVESDCPYLTPVAWSIRRNEPAYCASVAAAVAGVRGVPVETLERITTENTLRILTRIPR